MDIRVMSDPKMLRETLCLAQFALNNFFMNDMTPEERLLHSQRLSELISECDRHRPLGPDGKHGDRHTETCGCEDR